MQTKFSKMCCFVSSVIIYHTRGSYIPGWRTVAGSGGEQPGMAENGQEGLENGRGWWRMAGDSREPPEMKGNGWG